MVKSQVRGGRGKGGGKGIEPIRLSMSEASKNSPADNRQMEFELDLKAAIERVKRGETKSALMCSCRHRAAYVKGAFLHRIRKYDFSEKCPKCNCKRAIPYSKDVAKEKGRWASI